MLTTSEKLDKFIHHIDMTSSMPDSGHDDRPICLPDRKHKPLVNYTLSIARRNVTTFWSTPLPFRLRATRRTRRGGQLIFGQTVALDLEGCRKTRMALSWTALQNGNGHERAFVLYNDHASLFAD